jgi:proteasome lid subunit RPN8/RPN11
MKLVLADALRGEIARAAKAALPRECCGLIEGLAVQDGFCALALHPAQNLAVAPDRFEIDPADHVRAVKSARERGRRIIGCYHSHPQGSAEPSPRDLAGAQEDNFVWLIAAADRLQGFVYSAGGFMPVGLATGADLVTSSP